MRRGGFSSVTPLTGACLQAIIMIMKKIAVITAASGLQEELTMKKYLALLLVAAAIFGGILAFMDQDGDPGHGGSNPPAAGSGGAGGAGSNEIQAGVQRTIEDKSFEEADEETRGQLVEAYLNEAADSGTTDDKGNTIVKESIQRDEKNKLCLYVDTDGGLNIVQYGRDDSYTTGETQFREDFSDMKVKDTRGIILFGLDGPDSNRAQEQEAIAEQLRQNGSDCGIDTSVTVSEYKTNMAGYDYIILRTHGSMLNYGYGLRNESSDKVPVLCTLEEINAGNLEEYSEDIREQRIAKVTVIVDEKTRATKQYYWIMPSFFMEYYEGGELDGSYVHMGNCCGFGCSQDGDGSVDYTLADVLLFCGADAVTGFYNSVFTYYGSDMISTIMSNMLSGKTLEEAVDAARRAHGEDDGVYAEKQGWLNTGSPYYESTRKKLDSGVARIIIEGDPQKSFAPVIPEEPEKPVEVPDEPAAPKTYQIVGEWIDLARREELGDALLWDDEIVFSNDGSGYIAQSGGATEFLYTLDEEGVVYITTFNGNEYQGKISDDNTTLTVLYQDEFNDYEVVYTLQQ